MTTIEQPTDEPIIHDIFLRYASSGLDTKPSLLDTLAEGVAQAAGSLQQLQAAGLDVLEREFRQGIQRAEMLAGSVSCATCVERPVSHETICREASFIATGAIARRLQAVSPGRPLILWVQERQARGLEDASELEKWFDFRGQGSTLLADNTPAIPVLEPYSGV